MNIVLITTDSRPALVDQSVRSMVDNADRWGDHALTIVVDGGGSRIADEFEPHFTIINRNRQGASASRNIGACSIPKYRRQSHVMFLDDDVFMCPGWDVRLMELADQFPRSIVSGYGHPYNHAEMHSFALNGHMVPYGEPLIISTVCMLMPWALWDDVGFFSEPGGPGGSEDYDFCVRAVKKQYDFVISEPHLVIHTGLMSSSGKPIIGHREMVDQNKRLVELHGLKDVRFE